MSKQFTIYYLYIYAFLLNVTTRIIDKGTFKKKKTSFISTLYKTRGFMFDVNYACVIQNAVHMDPKPYINTLTSYSTQIYQVLDLPRMVNVFK